ncbi:MAG: hypothetical protein AAGF71_12890 [Pseudomonadota bacterium]
MKDFQDKAQRNRARVVAADVAKVRKNRDRRRFTLNNVPNGTSRILTSPEQEGTIFPNRCAVPNEDDQVLKDGRWNSKIGGDVLVGHLKGAVIYTLTLEERATCPRSCEHWRSCYGNNMSRSTRWTAGPELEAALVREVDTLCGRWQTVLIRLHVLGDFYSPEYVGLWHVLMERHANLWCFGFTAHAPNTQIGQLLAAMRLSHGQRWSVRHSGQSGAWGSFTVDFPTLKKRIGGGVVCPEQHDAMNGGPQSRHCGNCAVCWSCDDAIVFVEH